MKTNFENALKHVLVHEGGWSDHPKDPGGATMKGITLEVYRNHYGANKTKDDLKNIPDSELQQIYRTGYWNKCKCDELPSGIDYAVFDAAVNSGPGRGAKWLQSAVGATPDGGIGTETLGKLKNFDSILVVNKMCDNRLGFLQSLNTWPTFGKGWAKRVDGVRDVATSLAKGQSFQITPMVEQPPSVDFETVRNGSTGPWVKKLQEALKIPADGTFGNGTETALKKWQTENGLKDDGIAGRKTFQALGLIP